MLVLRLKDLDQGKEEVEYGEAGDLERFLIDKFPELHPGMDLKEMAQILHKEGFWDVEVKRYQPPVQPHHSDPFDPIHQECPWPRAADMKHG